MVCPACGAAVQPYDRFCIHCGHDMQPGAQPQQRPAARGMPAGTAQQAPYGTATQEARPSWASGSSFPQSNPYSSVPNTVSSGTTLNGRSVGANNGGVLKGLGAAVIAFFVILGKVAHGIAFAGIFKLLFYWWAFRLLFGLQLGWVVLVILAIVVIGAIMRSQMA